MARTYRKTDQAVAKLRKAMGVLESPSLHEGSAIWMAAGTVAALLEFALIDLDGVADYQNSAEYDEGAAKVAAWNTPLPFPED